MGDKSQNKMWPTKTHLVHAESQEQTVSVAFKWDSVVTEHQPGPGNQELLLLAETSGGGVVDGDDDCPGQV